MHGPMLFEIIQGERGPPVDWNSCLFCSKDMGAEERYRIAIGGRVGIGHKRCQDEVLGTSEK
jgi:hypothetical protein